MIVYNGTEVSKNSCTQIQIKIQMRNRGEIKLYSNEWEWDNLLTLYPAGGGIKQFRRRSGGGQCLS